MKTNEVRYKKIQKKVKSRNGQLLDSKYIGALSKYKVKCSLGHVWKVTGDKILQGRWCPVCAKKTRSDKTRKYSVSYFKRLAKKRNGECHSTIYKSSETRLLFNCEFGHKWETSAASVLAGSWCPTCAGKEQKNIQFYRKIATANGGSCLSSKVKNAKDILKWKCSSQHVWSAQASSITQGSWCPRCIGRNKSIKDMQKIAIKNGGICLSKKYSGQNSLLLWKCANNHIWKAAPKSIAGGKRWCPTCSHEKRLQNQRKYVLKDIQDFVLNRGGLFLSTSYSIVDEVGLFQCQNGHQWSTTVNSVLRGSWCQICAGYGKPTIENLNQIATERGGYLLSKKYVNATSHLKWKCKYGHKWLNSYSNIYKGQWCPECSKGIGERVTRIHFERIFRKPFQTIRPDWLISPIGYKLELDGYNEDLKLAFEYQGNQHNEMTFHHKSKKSLELRKLYDRIKKRECKKRGITLVSIPQMSSVSDNEKVKDFIINFLKSKKFKLPENIPNYKINLKNAYAFNMLDKYKKIASLKNWHILEKTYVSSKHHLTVVCGNKHKFKILPTNFLRRNCKLCAMQLRSQNQSIKNIQKLSLLVKSKNGSLITPTQIKNQNTKIEIECDKKHRWKSSLSSIKYGSWCPECGRIEAARKRKLQTLSKINFFAEQKGGSCLSESYTGKNQQLKFKCNKEHVFSASWWTVSHGGWCKECKKK